MKWIVKIALLFFCGTATAWAAEEIKPLDVDTILTTPADEESYVDAPRCISSQRIRSVEVLDDRHVAFRMSRSKFFLVQFTHACPTLRVNSAIAYDVRNHRVCALDGLRPLNGYGVSAQPAVIACRIPGFQEINKEQLALLRESLKGKRGEKLIDAEPVSESAPEAAPGSAVAADGPTSG
ncbi:MAG: DUF6491 family protein [Gammaproteobacteria bacterium]|nr:DUF6491 family protein [Gammaproteobacteria bacterium]